MLSESSSLNTPVCLWVFFFSQTWAPWLHWPVPVFGSGVACSANATASRVTEVGHWDSPVRRGVLRNKAEQRLDEDETSERREKTLGEIHWEQALKSLSGCATQKCLLDLNRLYCGLIWQLKKASVIRTFYSLSLALVLLCPIHPPDESDILKNLKTDQRGSPGMKPSESSGRLCSRARPLLPATLKLHLLICSLKPIPNSLWANHLWAVKVWKVLSPSCQSAVCSVPRSMSDPPPPPPTHHLNSGYSSTRGSRGQTPITTLPVHRTASMAFKSKRQSLFLLS